jgi:hypothetical protein
VRSTGLAGWSAARPRWRVKLQATALGGQDRLAGDHALGFSQEVAGWRQRGMGVLVNGGGLRGVCRSSQD